MEYKILADYFNTFNKQFQYSRGMHSSKANFLIDNSSLFLLVVT